MTTPPDADAPEAGPPTPAEPIAPTPAWRRWFDDPQHRKVAVGAAVAIVFMLIVVTRLGGGVGTIGPTGAGPGNGPGTTVAPGDIDIEHLKRATVLITTHPTDPEIAGCGLRFDHQPGPASS